VVECIGNKVAIQNISHDPKTMVAVGGHIMLANTASAPLIISGVAGACAKVGTSTTINGLGAGRRLPLKKDQIKGLSLYIG
jgi:hypothetical protein